MHTVSNCLRTLAGTTQVEKLVAVGPHTQQAGVVICGGRPLHVTVEAMLPPPNGTTGWDTNWHEVGLVDDTTHTLSTLS
jgi:hypothetical protein